jgi:hypothetical protein
VVSVVVADAVADAVVADLLSFGLFHKKSEQVNWQRKHDGRVLFS